MLRSNSQKGHCSRLCDIKSALCTISQWKHEKEEPLSSRFIEVCASQDPDFRAELCQPAWASFRHPMQKGWPSVSNAPGFIFQVLGLQASAPPSALLHAALELKPRIVPTELLPRLPATSFGDVLGGQARAGRKLTSQLCRI